MMIEAPGYMDLLTPSMLTRLARIRISARGLVNGFKGGDHRSLYLGSSTEFADYRDYSPGDDPRDLDWRVFGRMDRYYVKQYVEQTNLRATILLDASGSMGFAGDHAAKVDGRRLDKFGYARRLAATMAYLLTRQGDAVGLVTFDTRICDYLPPVGTVSHLQRLLETMHARCPGGESSMSDVLHEIARRMPRRGLVLLISDFFDDVSNIAIALHHLRRRKHELILFHVLAEEEIHFPFSKVTRFRNLERHADQLDVDPAAIRREYLGQFNEYLGQLESEWLKFDVIVLGDVDPGDLGSDAMHTLEKFVKHRGGTLVLISGRQYMPHAYSGTQLAAAMPIQLDASPASEAINPDVEYSLRVTAGAESHPIMQLSTGPEKSDSIWGSLPSLHWRHPNCRAKAGATVLAYAADMHGAEGATQHRREQALILWHRFGIGKVLQLTFDQTWRLRYGTGDRYYHRFWGQVLRWSVQDRLTAGTEQVRLGTDQAIYRAGQTVTVRARLLDNQRNPIESRDTRISIFLDDRLVGQTALIPQPDSGGMLSATIDNLDRPGNYSMELTGPTVDRLLREEGRTGQRVLSELTVEGAEPTTELSDYVADATAPSQIADWSGGIITTPDNAAELLNRLGPKSTFHREQWTVPLWNLWPVLILFLLIVNTEWIIRRTTGLV